MTWTKVKWTEAGQVAQMVDDKLDLGADARTRPIDYFAKLRVEDRLDDAVFFLGQALPRFETVAWATRAVRDLREAPLPAGGDADALRAALLWLQDPTDARRRAAFEASKLAGTASPERYVALGAFFSGGSLTPPEVQAVQPPRDAVGKFAAGAVLLAALAAKDRVAALNRALDAGNAIAGA
ncbi:MAG TPA: hypothetical protein VG248_09255 [Caulobacteraceae bacterium]|jgi:hypothetical protein|nr:hypothetical protein [Caulobacteraceae bacterium]